MTNDIRASAESDLITRGHRRVVGAGPLAALSLSVAGGAVLSSSCCAVPLAFAMAGLGGAWLSIFGELALYKNYVLGAAVLALAVGWIVAVRSRTKACEGEPGCKVSQSRGWTFWALTISTILVCLATLSDFLEPSIVAYMMSLRGEG